MSADDRQASEHLDDADRWLQQHSRLDALARRQLVGIAIELLKRVRKAQASPLIISGPPGCGKTTLSRLFDHLVKQEGETCQVLSLDDYYLTRSEREILANKIHPLLRHRGVPGTHDWHR